MIPVSYKRYQQEIGDSKRIFREGGVFPILKYKQFVWVWKLYYIQKKSNNINVM